MKKTILSLSIVLMAFASITFTSCKNSPKSTEESEATEKMVAVEYQCPMKCEGEKTYTEMGACPECGMDLVILKSDSTKQMVMEAYQCPMKCEGEKTYAEMGICPECGMDLKKITEESAEHDHSEEGHTH